MKRTTSPKTVFFQPQAAQVQNYPILHLRRPPQDVQTTRIFDGEQQRLGIRHAVETLMTQVMTTLPESSLQRAIFIDWRTRFLQNPLQTDQQRHHAAMDLEWLFYEQIETQMSLRRVIDERQINSIGRVLLGSQEKVFKLREKYRAKARALLENKITQETLALYREFIGELFYEMGVAVSKALVAQRESAQAAGRNTEAVIHEASTQIHEAYMQSAGALSELRNEVVQTYHACQAAEKTHQATIEALTQTMKGSS